MKVKLSGCAASSAENLDVELFYEFYIDSPVLRKWIVITNKSSSEMILTDLEWEKINYEIAQPFWIPKICTFPDVYAQYGQSVHKPPYIGRTDDAALFVYDYEKREGILIGNEAPSVIKRTSVYSDSTVISIGMGLSSDDFPFRKYLNPDESFTSLKGFLMVSSSEVWQDAFDTGLADFVRKYMGIKLFERDDSYVHLQYLGAF